jgi:RNA polymerase sigma factor (sigma-70 family)
VRHSWWSSREDRVMARERLSSQDLAEGYARDARRLLTWFTRRTTDAQLAVDLVAETYARAFASRRRFRGDPGDGDDLAAWTWGIARNVLHDALRRGGGERRAIRRLGLEPPALDDFEIARIEELAELGTLRAAVADALDDLSPEQREAVRLRVVAELDYCAIARRLGISEQAARTRVSRGLRALGTALEGTG